MKKHKYECFKLFEPLNNKIMCVCFGVRLNDDAKHLLACDLVGFWAFTYHLFTAMTTSAALSPLRINDCLVVRFEFAHLEFIYLAVSETKNFSIRIEERQHKTIGRSVQVKMMNCDVLVQKQQQQQQPVNK